MCASLLTGVVFGSNPSKARFGYALLIPAALVCAFPVHLHNSVSQGQCKSLCISAIYFILIFCSMWCQIFNLCPNKQLHGIFLRHNVELAMAKTH